MPSASQNKDSVDRSAMPINIGPAMSKDPAQQPAASATYRLARQTMGPRSEEMPQAPVRPRAGKDTPAWRTMTKSVYNSRRMAELLFEEIKSYVEFTPEDGRLVAAMADRVRPLLGGVIERFYDALLQNKTARAVFTGGAPQLARQKKLLTEWLRGVFAGDYGRSYFENRLRIGDTHLRVGLPQRYMVLGMEIIWRELSRGLKHVVPKPTARELESLHKVLSLDLTIMLESYQLRFADQIRGHERAAMEEKLTRAEHLAEIGQLAASLAHEIKNPLAGISGAIQIIGESMLADNPHRSIVGEILGQITRLDATVKDLLLYARPSPPMVSGVRLEGLVPRVLMLLREEPALRKVSVRNSCHPADAELVADEGQLAQLLMNLILNAAHASDEGATIHVSFEVDGAGTTITVEDFGQGMSPEVLATAFQPFFTTKAKGSGLGLSICKRIAESHGGHISLESQRGEGTKVTILLPTNAGIADPRG